MLNHSELQGRFVANPELNETNSGTKVCNFRIAWSEKYRERETKCFLECKSFGAQAEFIASRFAKGNEVVVEGKLTTEEWEKDGQKRSKNVLLLDKIHFCGKKEGSQAEVQPEMTPVTPADGELPF